MQAKHRSTRDWMGPSRRESGNARDAARRACGGPEESHLSYCRCAPAIHPSILVLPPPPLPSLLFLFLACLRMKMMHSGGWAWCVRSSNAFDCTARGVRLTRARRYDPHYARFHYHAVIILRPIRKAISR